MYNFTDAVLIVLAKTEIIGQLIDTSSGSIVYKTQDCERFINMSYDFVSSFETNNKRSQKAQEDALSYVRQIKNKCSYEYHDLVNLQCEISCMLMNKYRKTIDEI